MKKLYLLLANGLVLFAGVGTLTLSVAGCDHKKKDDTTTKIYDALNKFTKTSPLEIPYQTKPTAPASDPAITKAVKDLMKTKVPDIFTDTVLGKIKFDDTPLKVGEAVAVKATYNNDQEKAVTIYIKELTIESSVYSALAKFTKESPLEILYQTKPTAPASDPAITKAVKDLMKTKVPAIFTDTVLGKIKFDDTTLKVGEAVAVKATYNNDQEKAVTIYIKELTIESSVYSALAKFTKEIPLEIPYNQKNPTAPASNPAVTKAVKDLMKTKVPAIFTDTVLGKIKFDDTPLKVGEAVAVKATYNNDQEKAVTIYIKEARNPDQGVYDALASFDQTHSLLLVYQEEYQTSSASKKKVTKYLRLMLGYRRPDIFTEKNVKQITFNDAHLEPGKSVEILATYHGKTTAIYVQEDKKSYVSKVITGLNHFHEKTYAVELSPDKYNEKYTDESSWGDFSEKAGDAIRAYIYNFINSQSPIRSYFRYFFITFDHKRLIKDEFVEVNAHYLGQSTPIWVKLGYASLVKKVLGQFTVNNRLKLTQTTTEPREIFADDSTGTSKIRGALVAQSEGLLTQELAEQITFSHVLIGRRAKTIYSYFKATFHKKVVVVVDFVTN